MIFFKKNKNFLKLRGLASKQGEAKPRRDKFLRAFTLVEMIVVVAIIIVVTSVVLFKQSKFSSDILVTNAAYEVALSIRQAQVYGISSKQVANTNPAAILNVGYGINLTSPTSNSFIIYSDTGSNPNSVTNDYPFKYDSANPDEYALVDNPKLTQGQTILKFCVKNACSPTLNKLNIGFIKPKPEAIINDGTSPISGDAIIVIASALGDKCRVVRVTSIGQISVDAPKSDGSDCSVSS